MSRFVAFACAAVAMLFVASGIVSSEDPRETTKARGSFRAESSPLFLLHLLKLKKKIQTIERVPTASPTADCICVPYYLCDANRTVITDGVGTIDIRYRRCTGDLEVCCHLPNATTTASPTTTTTTATTMKTTATTMKTTATTMKTTTTTMKTTTTAQPTTTSTLPPIIFPNADQPATQICVCVPPSRCDANGIVGTSGEGVINPRLQFVQCPDAGNVCCRPSSVIRTVDPTTPSTATPPQICTLCGNVVQCISGAVVVNPVVTYGQQTCPVPTSCCQGINPVYGNGVPVAVGPVKNPGTPQACYCTKSWLCTPGNSISVDGFGVIDPRFSSCGNPDEVCCRVGAVTVQRGRDLEGLGESIVNGLASFSGQGCGVQNATYAPAQPYPAETGKTYFGEFPWMVALLSVQPDGKYLFQCGASLITENAVLTAAHCVANRDAGRLIARFGQWDMENQPSDQPLPFQDVNIRTVVTHPQFYSGALFNDIAVVILSDPARQAANVAPVCIPRQDLIFPAGSRCIGTGWGKNSFGGAYQTELRKVELPLVERSDCQSRLRTTKLGAYFQLHGSFICAGGEANRDTCRGDGGGPLVCATAAGRYFQTGIVSWGIGCGTSNVPAVYTDVAQFATWIDEQLTIYAGR